jgi:F-type H+-transporting ATPase subunit gamma
MTERLADISTRIAGIRQLGAVVNAIRGIAAARARQARDQLAGVDAYAAIMAAAIRRLLKLAPRARPDALSGPAHPALVVFCAEQGFAGAFSERILDAIGESAAGNSGATGLILIGTRGAALARERAVRIDWQAAMPAHSTGIPRLADHLVEALEARMATGEIGQLDVIFTIKPAGQAARTERRRLIPLDIAAFPAESGAMSPNGPEPLLNLPPETLLRDLAANYLHAQLCNAALHAFAAESEARMEAMAAAHTQIDRQLASLEATQRHVRQGEITAEIIELAAGESASRRD